MLRGMCSSGFRCWHAASPVKSTSCSRLGRTSYPLSICAASKHTRSLASGSSAPVALLIDGHNLAYRAYWGIVKGPLSSLQTSDGIPTSVTFGFIRTLITLLAQEQPDAVVVVFDAPKGSFRREMLPSYKSSRTRPPPEFAPDLANLQLLLRFARISTLSVPGYEADDVIAGLASQASQAGWRTVLVSNDRDLWQVVNDANKVSVLLPTAGGKASSRSSAGQHIDEAAVRQALGVDPIRVPDLKALMGDASDDIPGIPGIGPKTAAQLLAKCNSLETVFEQMASHTAGVKTKLDGKAEEAALFKSLATVRPEAAPAFDFEAARLLGINTEELEPLLRRLNMTSIVKELPRLQQLLGGVAAADADLLATLPAALQQLAACLNSSSSRQQQVEGPQAATDLAAAHQAGSSSPAAMSLLLAAADSGAAPAAAVRPATAGNCVLPDHMASCLPVVTLVESLDQLHDLVAELELQQDPVTWCWPQDSPYQPGRQAQQPPPVLCCAWQHTGGIDSKINTPDSSGQHMRASSASSLPHDDVSGHQAKHLLAGLPRRRRRMTRSKSPPAQLPARQQLQLQPQGQQLQQPQQQVCLRLAIICPNEQLPDASMISAVKHLLESTTHPKCFFESKRAFTELYHQGINLAGVELDVLVAGCLPDPERWGKALNPQHQQASALPIMVQHILHSSLPDMAAAVTATASQKMQHRREQQQQQGAVGGTSLDSQGAASVPAYVWHTAAEAWAIKLLADGFSRQLQQLGDGGQLLQLFQRIELPLQRVLSVMEVTGIRCDRKVLEQQRTQLKVDVRALEDQLFELAGERFNLNSPRERSAIIFDKLKLSGANISKTKSGYWSTSMSEIEKIEESQFKKAFLEWARLNALLKYYTSDSYMDAINPGTGRIHTTYHQVGVATGRIASSNPNMQAVPVHDERSKLFRMAFKADEGHLLVAADYSQVELRVMAALSEDEALLQAFAAGQDVHEATARDILGKGPQDSITTEERQLGKRVNFSIVYGAGVRQLAADVGISQKQARKFLDTFKAAHPKLFDYKTHCMRAAVANGYTLTALGRRRLYSFGAEQLRELRGVQQLDELPDAAGLQKMALQSDAQALRQAGNAPVQGTSADLLKAALVQLHATLAGPPHNCRLLLTIHDEVLLEVPERLVAVVAEQVASIMEQALPQLGFLVLKANVRSGLSWYDYK